LLTVSGSIPAGIEAEVAAGRRPRPDYVELARGLGADLIDRETARRKTGFIGRLLEAVIGADGLLAVACFLRCGAYRLVISDGEQIGLPLALLMKTLRPWHRPKHVMITHIISVRKKMLFLDWFGVQSRIDRFVVRGGRLLLDSGAFLISGRSAGCRCDVPVSGWHAGRA
jgi:hypothetical protein